MATNATQPRKHRDIGTNSASPRSDDANFADRDLSVESLAILSISAQICQQRSLFERQVLKRYVPASAAQERLDEGEVGQRRGEARIATGEFEYE